MLNLKINQQEYQVDVEPETPLLWVLRDTLKLTGTKFGCGKGQCGACTIHLNGVATRCCILPVAGVVGTEITTIEGLSKDDTHPVQQAWIENDIPQCGYCQSGQIMTAASLLQRKPNPTDEDINLSMINICRCGTHSKIRKGIHHAAKIMAQKS